MKRTLSKDFHSKDSSDRSSFAEQTVVNSVRGGHRREHRNFVKRRLLKAELLEARCLMTASLGYLTSDEFWEPVEPSQTNLVTDLRAVDYELFSLSTAQLRAQLAGAPLEFTEEAANSNVTITLPRPDGSLERFTVFVSPIMEAGLAAQFPEIQTYAGQGIDDPGAKLRFDLTPAGFHGQVLSPQGAYYVDPYSRLNPDSGLYATYFATGDFHFPEAKEFGLQNDLLNGSVGSSASGNLGGNSGGNSGGSGLTGEGPSGGDSGLSRTGTELRIYRTAVAATGEYTAFHGGTVAAGQAAIVTAINRVSGIYESELSIRLQLVANNNLLVYTNAATDPYSNNNPGALLSENQANVDAVIGSANYDVGHVFNTGGGGLAGLGVVGINGRKAQGQTGLPTPINDAFYVDYVAHEIGHQFGGNHTFNSSTSSCNGNRNASTAYEPGSGSTIQAYAGICGTDNLQPNSDPYFHSISLDEMLRHVDIVVPNVGSRIPTGNSVPTVNAGADYTIPARTPFLLTAIGSDANATDQLTYSWEQRDLGPSTTVTAADNGSSPLFRAIVPTVSPTRYFPRLSSVINQTSSIGEVVPTTTRALNFRATVRDNRIGGGGVNTDDVRLSVVDTGATFRVTSPSTAVSWDGLSAQTVTWDVAGTNAGLINTPNVSIFLSTDGGQTFPIVVLASTPNDGTQQIAVPNFATNRGRLMVRGENNVFFNVNTANFTIVPTPIDINLGAGTASYVENAAPIIVSPNATVVDFFNTNYAGLSLTSSIILNRESTDVLSFVSVGNGPGEVSFTPTRVRFGGVDVGGWTGLPNLLTVNFNAAATPTALAAIIQRIAYSSTSESPSTLQRTFQVSMGAGLSATRGIQVSTLNDSPTLVDVTLPVIDEDVDKPFGRQVAAMFAGGFVDPDAGARMSGLAVVGNTTPAEQGKWFFSSDLGSTWAEIISVDDDRRSLLISPQSFIGFQPAPNYFGSPIPLEVRALDETYTGALFSSSTGSSPLFLDPAVRTPNGPVSTNRGKIQARIRNINDAPQATLPLISINAVQDSPLNFKFPADLFVDVDSANLEWTITPVNVQSIPEWIQFSTVTRTLTGTPLNGDVGLYRFQLTATDSAGAAASIPLTINVANVNDPPEQLTLRGQIVAENDIGVRIGDVSVFDPDPTDTVTFAVSDSRFTIRDGVLYLQSTAFTDYEVEPVVTLVITATDNGTPTRSTSVPFQLEVVDRNEFFPDLRTQSFRIPAVRADNHLLGTVSATDADIFQTVKYRVQEDDAGIFEVGETTGQVRLKPGAQVTATNYRLFISAFDNGSPSNSRVVLFNVDVEIPNQFAPVIPAGQRFTVPENSAVGTSVGSVVAQDADGDTNLQFAIGAGPFTINPATGLLAVASGAVLNFEAQATYVIPVQVTDSGSPARIGSSQVTITLVNVNDAPTAIALTNANVIANQRGITLAPIIVTDEDPATQYIFTTTDARFEVRDGRLALKPTNHFANSLAGTTSTVDVTVTDASDPTSSSLLPLRFTVTANPFPWQNQVNRLDVNSDGQITALDALLVVNSLNGTRAGLARGALRVPRELSDLSQPLVDTSGDNILSPLDVSLIINSLTNRGSSRGGGEGESVAGGIEPSVWYDAFNSLEQDRKRRTR